MGRRGWDGVLLDTVINGNFEWSCCCKCLCHCNHIFF